MMYDHGLNLIGYTITQDSIGNEIRTPTTTTVLCEEMSVGRNEFYNAAQNGMKPEIILKMHAYEYSGQESVEYYGVKYKVLRTFKVGIEEIELTCERVIGNG